ncbi:MAG: GH25 family lysozyme [Oscillospiraceae bacterium]|nr:GH25 family lysozyme [Oscillospiraceae bacterium]
MKKYVNIILGVVLSLSIWFSIPISAFATLDDTGFSDVPSSSWYADAVVYCQKNHWMNGTSSTTFSPDSTMSRAMLVTVLYRMAGSPSVSSANSFSDVAADGWYRNAVLWASQTNLVNGYGGTRFGPNDPVSREQFTTILWRKEGAPSTQNEAIAFADGATISNWAADAVLWANETGMINGKPDNRFDPQGNATRAEAAVILRRYLAATAPTPTPTPTPTPSSTTILPNSYNTKKFFMQNGFLYYDKESTSHAGIDVSSYQGKIDWERVAASGVDFAIIRAGYRGYTFGNIQKDSYFTQNIEGALASGLDVGVYIFSQATTTAEAREEARQLLNWTEDYPITYPLVFDWERVSQPNSRTQNTDGKAITACAKAFCDTITGAGHTPMVYGNPSMVYASELDISKLTDTPFWLAHYTSGWAPTNFRYHYHMWQYTSTGQVDGISGNVDLNLCFIDF